MFKWFERHFLVKIQKYQINILDRIQTSFVEGMGTRVNILLHVLRLKSLKKH